MAAGNDLIAWGAITVATVGAFARGSYWLLKKSLSAALDKSLRKTQTDLQKSIDAHEAELDLASQEKITAQKSRLESENQEKLERLKGELSTSAQRDLEHLKSELSRSTESMRHVTIPPQPCSSMRATTRHLMTLALSALISIETNPAHADTVNECRGTIFEQRDPGDSSARVLVLGEIHGTNEMPEAVRRELRCHIKRNESVTLLLELPLGSLSRSSLCGKNRHMVANALADIQRVAGADGRTSVAMMNLIEYALFEECQQDGLIHIQPIDPSGQGLARDLGLAQNIIAAIRSSRPPNRVIVLVGNWHAMERRPRGAPKESMAWYLLRNDLSFETVLFRTEGGTAWNCFNKQCSSRAVGRDAHGALGELVHAGSPVTHEYELNVGPISAASPTADSP